MMAEPLPRLTARFGYLHTMCESNPDSLTELEWIEFGAVGSELSRRFSEKWAVTVFRGKDNKSYFISRGLPQIKVLSEEHEDFCMSIDIIYPSYPLDETDSIILNLEKRPFELMFFTVANLPCNPLFYHNLMAHAPTHLTLSCNNQTLPLARLGTLLPEKSNLDAGVICLEESVIHDIHDPSDSMEIIKSVIDVFLFRPLPINI